MTISGKGETEVKKDKEDLVKYLEKEISNFKPEQMIYDYLTFILKQLNQLDEPEVLSPEWIDEHKKGMFMDSEGRKKHFVWVDDLQNLIVPKQELPVIPKFVAEWIEDNKQFEEKRNDYSKEDAMSDTIHFTIYGLFADYPATNSHVELRKPVLKWLSDDRGNYFKLVNAVRYGYEVEEEQKYVVRTNLGTYLILDMSKREWDYTSIPPQDDDIQYAYKFDDRSMAEGIAKLVEGKVEELD